jgi:CRISPR-associated protein Cas5h
MDIASFDIVGKFAHFRKFYSNSTALSFTTPPRTTIMGMLAAMAGRGKEAYYDDFSSERLLLGLDTPVRLKKTIHRLNHLKIEKDSDFRGGRDDKHTQTPFEVVTGADVRRDFVRYRIYVAGALESEGAETLREIYDALENRRSVFNLSLGVANFVASVENVRFDYDAERRVANSEDVELRSAVNVETLERLNYKVESEEEREIYQYIEEEQLPADFKADGDREVRKMNRILYLMGDAPLKARISGEYFHIASRNVDIQFLT